MADLDIDPGKREVHEKQKAHSAKMPPASMTTANVGIQGASFAGLAEFI
jgi:hypothetical protein